MAETNQEYLALRARPSGHADRRRPWRHSAGLWHGTWAAARGRPSIPLPTPLKPGGEMRWGQPLTKSFQYLRRKIGLDRFDVALYSSRHWFADLIDNSDIKDVTRRRLMGHSAKKDIPSRYGRKQRLTNRDLAQLTTISSPIIDEMAKLLLQARDRASRGELRVLKPWLTPSNWSDYYRQRLFQKARLEARRWAQEGHAEATANAVSLCRRKRFRSVVICFARICSIDPRWGRTTLHQS
ncbi:hypothetical protein [Chelativorans composti]